MDAFKILLRICAFLGFVGVAHAQYIEQSGPVTNGHLPVWVVPNVVQDAGTPANPLVTALGMYGSGSCPFGLDSANPAITSGWNQICFGYNSSGGLMSLQAYGTQAGSPFDFYVNGNFAMGFTASGGLLFNSGAVPYSALPSIASKAILGNNTATSGPPGTGYFAANTTDTIVPLMHGALTQNDVVCLADGAGTLKDCGGGTTGTVTSVGTGTGLTGGPITTSGTISVTGVLADLAGISQTQGDIYYYNGTHLVALAPGSSGQLLQSGGSGANPSWTTASGTGTVTNIATGTGVTGGPITTTGTIALASVSNGTVLGNSSGSSHAPTAQTVSTGLSLSSGALSCATGSASVEGCIETDGSTISVSGGVISCTTATASQIGCVEPDNSTITISAGVISATGSSPGLAFIASNSFTNQSAVTICSSGCTLTNAFGSTYEEYEIHLVNVVPASSGGVVLEMLSSTNGGSSYANSSNNYAWQANGLAAGTGITAYSTGSTLTSYFSLSGGEELTNAAPGYSSVVKIIGPATGSQYTMVAVRDAAWYDLTNTTYAATMTISGAFVASTSAVNAVKILASSGNISGYIALYGVRKQ